MCLEQTTGQQLEEIHLAHRLKVRKIARHQEKNDPLFSSGHNISLAKMFKSNLMPGNEQLLG
jgi:hypothetical protein